tara:strand:+ start:486 stop:638 length:153 start_codon:yes stop_codon:yes gene_type:complete
MYHLSKGWETVALIVASLERTTENFEKQQGKSKNRYSLLVGCDNIETGEG